MAVSQAQEDLLSRVHEAATDVAAHRDSLTASDSLLRERIREAIRHGCSVGAIARESGLTRARIYQIRDGRR